MTASLGRIVHYVLTEAEAVRINTRRYDFDRHTVSNEYKDTGYIAHYGSEVRAGDIFPMTVTRTYGWTDAINGQVTLDGNDTLWVADVVEGVDPGTWRWPPRV